jgi:hypothetical protein
MKWMWLLLVALFLIPAFGHAKRKRKPKVYKVWVYTMDDVRVKGYLSKADSSGVVVSGTPSRISPDTLRINFENIKSVKYRRKGAGGRGTLIGLGSGATAGFLLGIAGGDQTSTCHGWFGGTYTCTTPAEEVGTVYAVLGGVTGSIVGAIAGGSKKEMIIEGGPTRYAKQLESLKNLVVPDRDN